MGPLLASPPLRLQSLGPGEELPIPGEMSQEALGRDQLWVTAEGAALAWWWAAPALGAERPEGSAPKPRLDGPEGALLGHVGIPLPLAEPWVSLPRLMPSWTDFLL